MPDDAPLTTARVATSPTQAKLFVAMLEAEGIPAFVEGDSLADEVAVSRRLMNVAGTHVKVREDQLARAQEVLGAVEIDDAELEAQAMAEPPAEPSRPRETQSSPGWILWIVVFAIIGALVWHFTSD